MNMQQAQATITAAIMKDPEGVIAAAIAFTPSASAVAEATRKVPGPLSGVAAATCRDALRGADNAATIANMVRFAETL
jgi:hypothetical protein